MSGTQRSIRRTSRALYFWLGVLVITTVGISVGLFVAALRRTPPASIHHHQVALDAGEDYLFLGGIDQRGRSAVQVVDLDNESIAATTHLEAGHIIGDVFPATRHDRTVFCRHCPEYDRPSKRKDHLTRLSFQDGQVSIESSAILPVRCDSGHCSPNSEMIGLTHGHDGLVALWDSQNNRMVKSTHLAPTSLSWVKGRSQRLLFHPDGKRIVGIARDSESIHLLDQTLQTIQVLSSNNRKLNCIAFSAQANRLIAGTDTGGLVIWNCEDSSSVRVQGISKEGIGWICVNDRHGEVIVAAVDGLVSQWQWREGSLRFVQSAQFDSLYGVVLSQRRDTLFVLETDIGIHGEITSLHALDCRTFARRELVTSR